MTSLNLEQCKDIFNRAIELDPDARQRFVAEACGNNPAARQQVDALLRGYAHAAEFMREPTLPIAPAEPMGTMVGPYKLLQLIGEGGFGSVYLAEQEQPVRRRVALKIIKLGMDTRQVIARFEAERQALALMEHPNIAKVLDAGATAGGRPYFVMELVKGDPITSYCDTNNLNTEHRLDLFVQVCHAVQHAHAKGIIHRDIKPSNVLVTIIDGKPVPKVIDFGIAKATASRLTEKTLFTEHRQLIGTPEYMSPEQAEMSGVDVDTRSDVYSLGVLLYELLTGGTPFDGQRLRSAAYGEIQRIIREEEPDKPSTRLSSMNETIGNVAAHRHSEPARLAKLVRGDLDWIVMKCLEKDRTRRYGTTEALADDVQRHLSGEPVNAAPPSAAYRFNKFVRRHKVGVAAGMAIAVTLLVGIVGTSLGLAWAMRGPEHRANDAAATAKSEAERAEREKELAQHEQQRAETVTDFVVNSLQSQDPNAQGQQDMTVAQAMAQALDAIDQGELREQPETEATMLDAIARILNGNGRSSEAQPLSERALQITQQLHPGDHPDVAQRLNSLATVCQWLGRADEAEPMFAQSLDMCRRLYEGDHPRVSASLANLANVREELGLSADAESLYMQSLEMDERLFKGDHVKTATAMDNLAGVRESLGRPIEAEPLFVKAFEMRRRLFKGDHPSVALSMHNVAIVWDALGRSAEAEPLHVHALEMQRRLFKGDHPYLAEFLSSLAFVRTSQGRVEESLSMHREVLSMRQRLYKGDHRDVATSLNGVGAALESLGRLADAEPLFVQSLEMRQRLYEGDDPVVATSLAYLGIIRNRLGRAEEAERLHVQATEMYQRLYKGDHRNVAASMSNVAEVRSALGQLADAEQLLAKALEMRQRLYTGDHAETATSMSSLARARLRLGHATEAEPLAREALAMQRRLNDSRTAVANACLTLALVLLDSKQPVEAEALAREALEIRQTAFPDGHMKVWQRFSGMSILGETLGRQAEDSNVSVDARIAKLREAEPLLLDAYIGMKDDSRVPMRTDEDDQKRKALARIVRLYETWETVEPGKGYQQKAQEWRKPGGTSP